MAAEFAFVRRASLLLLLALGLIPDEAMAHAILVRSQPAPGTSVPTGKMDMVLHYNSRIDRVRSRLTLIQPDSSQVVLTIGPSGPPDTLSASAQLPAPGSYVLRWQVLAVDGHITRGDVPFTVTGP